MDFDSLLNSQLGKMIGLTEKDRSMFEKTKKIKPKVKKPKKMETGGVTKEDMMGASPAEVKEMSRKKRADAQKKRTVRKKQEVVRGSRNVQSDDLARLEKQKKATKEFEKGLEQKKRSQTSKFGLFDIGSPRLGVLTGRRGKNIPRGDITKKMSNGGSNKMIDEPEFKDLRKALRKIEVGLTNIPKSKRGKGMGKKIRNMRKNPMMKNRGGTFKGTY